MRSPPVFSRVRVIQSLVVCVMLCRSLFVLFLLAIVLSVLLRFTDSDYSFGIFKPFLSSDLWQKQIVSIRSFCFAIY